MSRIVATYSLIEFDDTPINSFSCFRFFFRILQNSQDQKKKNVIQKCVKLSPFVCRR